MFGTVGKAVNYLNSRIFLNKVFVTANKFLGNTTIGSDFLMVISGYELTTFFVKTHGLPSVLQDGNVELTTRGVKTSIPDYIQTLNTIQVTFNERDSLLAKTLIETILLEGKNGSLEVRFFAGKTILDTQLWGKMFSCQVTMDSLPQVSVDDVSTPLELTVSLKGHYIPSKLQRSWAFGSGAFNAIDNPVTKSLF
jgi:hypothetical protein